MGERLALVELVELSDVGRVRHHNEDRALGRGPVIAVADGMGGAKAGEVAAQMAIDSVAGLEAGVALEDVRAAIVDANGRIHELARVDSEKAGMGTTFTGALLSGSALGVVHVGDSRAYLWRGGELSQLTEDHSVVAELVRRGSLTPEEAEVHPHRNVITRALGAESRVQPDVVTHPLADGDVVLLCSDGLSTYVRDEDIAEVLAGAPDLDAAAAALVERANRAGGADNVTVVLARVAEAGEGAAGAGDTATLATVEEPLPPPRGATAEMRVLGGTRGHAGTERPGGPAPSPPPRVLEPVDRRRRRVLPTVAVLVIGAAAAGLSWVGSRTYTVEPAADGTVRVMHGLPFGVAGWEADSPWQTTSVPADAVRAGRPDALSGSWRGQGDAVVLTVDLVWRYALPEPPDIAPPVTGGAGGIAEEPAPGAAGDPAAPGDTDPESPPAPQPATPAP